MLRPKIFAVVALTNGRGRVTWSCRVIIREECAYEQRSKLTAAELLRVQQRGARGTHVQPKGRREGTDCRYRFSSRQWNTGTGPATGYHTSRRTPVPNIPERGIRATITSKVAERSQKCRCRYQGSLPRHS